MVMGGLMLMNLGLQVQMVVQIPSQVIELNGQILIMMDMEMIQLEIEGMLVQLNLVKVDMH